MQSTKLKELDSETFTKLLSKKDKVYLTFDYDGTLVPVLPKPVDSKLQSSQVEFLNKLANFDPENIKMAIVTGRSLANLKELIEGKGLDEKILLIGTHGAEIGKERSEQPHQVELAAIKEVFSNEPDIEFEEKLLSISIHYNNHPKPEALKEKLLETAKQYQDIFRIQEAHMILEYLPKDIDKGIAIDHLKKENPEHLLAYFGDELTDNHAFDRINFFDGLSVQIDTRLQDEKAQYLIKEVDELYRLLADFLLAKENKS